MRIVGKPRTLVGHVLFLFPVRPCGRGIGAYARARQQAARRRGSEGLMRAQKWLSFLGLALLLAGLAACRHTPDETRVREAIASAGQAAEQADAGGVIDPLSEDFDGNGGRLERKDLANIIRLARLRGEHVGVTLGPISVERRGERLVADFTVS